MNKIFLIGKRILAFALGTGIIVNCIPVSISLANSSQDIEIIINGDDVSTAANNVNGLTYKGYGLLSCNSTNNLLMDYKAESPEAYTELLQVLFGGKHPLLNHVKMEMGNDGNNSTGADSCTMRFENEEADVSRSPGFQLAADAKVINPDVKVSILRWEMPTWVQRAWTTNKTGAGYEAMYKWYRETVFDAYEKYGYILDYINPDTNETTSPDSAFIKWFKNRLVTENDFPDYMQDSNVQETYHNIKIIASDENMSLNIVPQMRKDETLYDAVDAIGFHYSTGDTTSTADYRKMADVDDKEVWYSEGCANFSYTEYQKNKTTAYGSGTIGGFQSPLALADNFIKSFVYSRKTHYIFQPAIGAFYEGSQYDHKEFISAREPWAGYIHYDAMIYLLQHFTKFSTAGWENAENNAGIWRVIPNASSNDSTGYDHLRNESGKPSYMTLASPDKTNFSIVMVNNSNRSLTYNVKPEKMDLKNNTMEIWESKTDSYMQYKGETENDGGYYNITVEPFSMVTLTTLDCDKNEEYLTRLPQERKKTVLDTDHLGKNLDSSNHILYADNYEYDNYNHYRAHGENYLTSRGNEPRYTVDFSGAFVVEDKKLKQVLPQSVHQWNGNDPNCAVGDFRWMNYKASVDVTVNLGYAGLNIRQQTGMGFEGSGYNLRITRDGRWTLKKRNTTVASGTVNSNTEGEYNLALEGKGATITAWINGDIVHTYTDSNPEYFGRVRLGCGWNETSFDNLLVEKIDGHVPYATTLIDNASDEVHYNGEWNITVAGEGSSSNDWYRSLSTTSAANSSFQFEMTGVGFAFIGQNGGTAKLDIEVDGKTIASDVTTQSSNQHCSTYLQYGIKDHTYHALVDDTHNVTVTVTSGTFVLDSILFLTTPVVDKTKLVSTINNAKNIDSSLYTYDSYKKVTSALSDAEAVLVSEDATLETINNALQALNQAVTELKKKVNKFILENTIHKAKAFNANNYTADSYAKFFAALTLAENVFYREDATQDEIDTAIKTLTSAMNNLIIKSVKSTIKLEKPTIKSVKNRITKNGSVVNITVGKVKYADSYIVYRIIGTKKTVIGTTTGENIKDKKPLSGKKAYYCAVAVSNEKGYTNSEESNKKSILLARDPAKVKVKKSGRHIIISYSKVKNVSGYYIYRSTSKNGVFTRLTKQSIKKLSYTDKKAKKKSKKDYYYKVISYGKNKTYSSGKISARIKI